MDSILAQILKERQEAGKCIICNEEISEKVPCVALEHSVFGSVMICERHIRVQGKER